MEIQIRTRHLPAAQALRAQTARRVRAALGGFAGAVRSVTVGLADLKRPGGGADKLCRVVVELTNSAAVVLETRGADTLSLVERVLDGVRQRVAAKLLPAGALVAAR